MVFNDFVQKYAFRSRHPQKILRKGLRKRHVMNDDADDDDDDDNDDDDDDDGDDDADDDDDES